MWVGPSRAQERLLSPRKASASLLLGSGEELQRPLPLSTLAGGPSEPFGQRRPTGPNLQQSCLGSQETGIKPPSQQPLHCCWEVLPGVLFLKVLFAEAS